MHIVNNLGKLLFYGLTFSPKESKMYFLVLSQDLTFILAEAENVSLFIQYISAVLCRTET